MAHARSKIVAVAVVVHTGLFALGGRRDTDDLV
jgi:hypothetical protein